jgi:16S rRNA (cytosine967-C5)-methyltransferase
MYQLFHLDRVPDSAVVHDAVALARTEKKSDASGFVNAVLRNALRNQNHLLLPQRPTSDFDHGAALAYLGITWSHPEWLIKRWLTRHGFTATEAWVQFNNAAPTLCLRVNRLRTTRNDVVKALSASLIGATPTRYAPDGIVVKDGLAPQQNDSSLFVSQDEASQLVCRTVAAQPGECVLDLCAAPGGKTAAMAADMADSGMLVACDVRPRRLELLKHSIKQCGATRVKVVRVDASKPLPFGPSFDRVLVDAPCSGLGILRRDPDIKWSRNEADLTKLANSQLSILTRAAETVRPGGRLVYATCSSEPEENEEVVKQFLANHSDYSRLDLRQELTGNLSQLIDNDGAFRSLPFAHALEAFFAAALVRFPQNP